MRLITLTTKNFRNLAPQTLIFHHEFNFIFGKNAQGKTNIIEAIAYISDLKSFRSVNKADLIQTGAAFASLKARVQQDERDYEIAVSLTPAERQVLVNAKRATSQRDYHSILPTILFEPRHIYLWRDTPSHRRQYLGRAMSLINPVHTTLLHDYDRVISQKNRLLKDRAPYSQIDVWNQQIVELGSRIIKQRSQWTNDISSLIAQEYESLSHSGETLSLKYEPSNHLIAPTLDQIALTEADIKMLLAQKIAERTTDEMERRESLVGPHRDDLRALLDKRDMGQFGSQGENRTAVIALKLAQLKMYVEQHGAPPLFLLDDVASELDEKRCTSLFSYLRDEHTQVFITTTENRMHGVDYSHHASFFEVENGNVTTRSHE